MAKPRKFKRRYRAKGKTSISVSAAAHKALQVVAESQSKSMRQVVEEWVDEAYECVCGAPLGALCRSGCEERV